ncbi:MAG: ABC transporter permease [Firmicutes bacterium HGW-Firmicutes-14]|nr:MAG: ABC transporter permease [Firmicutes bacterium HGW-Firmicutes-14]
MLKRKLLRDIRENYGAYIACISVIVIGLMMYVSLALTLESLTERQDEYYSEYRFAEGFAQIVRGPYGLVEDVGGVEGIDRVIGRIVQDVMVNKQAGEANTVLRLVTFEEKQDLNRFRLEEGSIPSGEGREILVSPAFLQANGYSVGDSIPLIIRGREVKFTITGTAVTPEYVYEIPSGQTLTPDPTVFGVAFVPYSVAAPLLGMDGSINDIAFTLEGGTEFNSVKRPVSRILEHYGLTRIYPRKDQLSHSMLSQEIVGLEGSVNTTPVIFLLVAAGILYIMLRRMVEQQRGQIGILKAFGFTDWEILSHYLGYAFIIGFLGGLLGGLGGTWLSFYFAQMYQQFFNIPDLTGRISVGYLLTGTILSLLFSLFAGYQGGKGVLKLSPAEAMRPPAPKLGKKTLVERISVIWQALNTQGKMAVRNVFRSKQRSLMAVFGISSAFAIMIASGASYDAVYYLIDFQYEKVERYDIKIGLQNYVDRIEGVSATRNIEGVKEAEPILEMPVTLTNGWREKDMVITGLPRQASLYHLVNDRGEAVSLPSGGLVISEQLAKTMDISQGDIVTIKPFLGDRRERQVQVRKLVPQYVGLGAYMEIDALSEIMQAAPAASSILVTVDSDRAEEVRRVLNQGQNITAIHDKNKMKEQFEELMESSQAQQFIVLFFSFVMGFAIVYNVNIISLSEREREMATLMVMGMTEGEIARILIFEQGLLGGAAVTLGIPMGYGMLWAIINAIDSEIYNMPLILEPGSILIALAGTAAFLVAAQWKTTERIAKLSMLDVLKEQD